MIINKNSIILLLLLFSSCASLTKSQLQAVNEFATTSSNFSDFPDKIIKEIEEVRVQRKLFYVNGLESVNDHLEELDNIHFDRLDDEKLASEINITFQIIDKYAQNLAILSSSSFVDDLRKKSYHLGKDLDSLIKINNRLNPSRTLPAGIGTGIGSLISISGAQFIRMKQAKEVKKFVLQADSLIQIMSDHLLNFLETDHLKQLIKIEESLKTDYRDFLSRHNKINTIVYDREYLMLKQKIDYINQMRNQTITASRNLAKSHHDLTKKIIKKEKLKERIESLQNYNEDVKNIQKLIKELSKKD